MEIWAAYMEFASEESGRWHEMAIAPSKDAALDAALEGQVLYCEDGTADDIGDMVYASYAPCEDEEDALVFLVSEWASCSEDDARESLENDGFKSWFSSRVCRA